MGENGSNAPAGDGTGDRVAMLVARCLELRDTGSEEFTVEEVCKDHPELIEEVRSSLDFVQALPKLQSFGPAGDPMLRTKLAGRYRIDSHFGSGAMGVVYSATDLDLGRRVAIKVVHARFLNANETVARFDREAAALAAISHESVVTIYDRGITDSGAPFLVMELIDGVPCSEILTLAERHKSTDDTAWLRTECGIEHGNESSLVRLMVRWAASLASGLEAAHAAGVYHRDVKPSNIMVRRDGRVVLLDFGIAALETDETMTKTGTALGTPAYMAPEALTGEGGRAKPAQDVYGLAATLYHLLTLRAPYEGSPREIMAALSVREPKPAVKIRPGLPRDAQAILDHGLARSPGGRYASPGAMGKDLRALLAFQPVSVNPTTRWTRTYRRFRRSKMAVGAVLATLIIGLGFGASQASASLATKRGALYHEIYNHVPANLGIVGPANRWIADEALRAEVEDVLNRLVDAGHQVVTARALRASFRLDHGNLKGAKADMQAAAAAAGTRYARKLAMRYDALPGDSQSALDLNLEDLPAAKTPVDFYLAGFHELRALRYPEAIDPLSHAGLNGNRHARELSALLMTLPWGQMLANEETDALFVSASQLLEEVRRIEIQFGSASAMSSHLAGTALMHQQRHADCVERSKLCTALAPSSYVAMVNGASSARLLGAFELARGFVESGRQIVPGYDKFTKIASEIELDAGDYALAGEIIESSGFGSLHGEGPAYLFARSRIDLRESEALFESSPEVSRAAAERAIEALASLPPEEGRRDELLRYARALATRAEDLVFHEIVRSLAIEPLSRGRLEIALEYWPTDSPDPAMELLAVWSRAILHELDRQAVNLTLTLPDTDE